MKKKIRNTILSAISFVFVAMCGCVSTTDLYIAKAEMKAYYDTQLSYRSTRQYINLQMKLKHQQEAIDRLEKRQNVINKMIKK